MLFDLPCDIAGQKLQQDDLVWFAFDADDLVRGIVREAGPVDGQMLVAIQSTKDADVIRWVNPKGIVKV